MRHYRHNIGDWAAATGHLSDVEEVIYLRLMHAYYLREQPLPLDPAMCRRMARARSPAAIVAVQRVLTEFFDRQNDGWHQRRCDAELEEWREKSAAATASINRRWEGRRGSKSTSTALRQSTPLDGTKRNKNKAAKHTDAHSDVILPTTHYPIESKATPAVAPSALPPWLPVDTWNQFLKARVAMRAKPTDHAQELLIGELAKMRASGQDPRAVLEQSIKRCWKGLFPVKPDDTNGGTRFDARTSTANSILGAIHHDERTDKSDPRDISGEAERVA